MKGSIEKGKEAREREREGEARRKTAAGEDVDLRSSAVGDFIGNDVHTTVSRDGDDRLEGTEIDTDDTHCG